MWWTFLSGGDNILSKKLLLLFALSQQAVSICAYAINYHRGASRPRPRQITELEVHVVDWRVECARRLVMDSPPAPPMFTLLVLANYIFGFADSCLRHAHKSNRPPNANGPVLPGDRYPTTRNPFSTPYGDHRKRCGLEDRRQTACLNGGECWRVPSPDGPVAFCKCKQNFEGPRCAKKVIYDPVLMPSSHHLHTAHLAAGVSASILIVFVVLLCVYVAVRYKAKRTKRQLHLQAWRNNQKLHKNEEKVLGADKSLPECVTTTDITLAESVPRANHTSLLPQSSKASHTKTPNQQSSDDKLL